MQLIEHAVNNFLTSDKNCTIPPKDAPNGVLTRWDYHETSKDKEAT